MFIVIEGIDGAGKGFQREQLVKYLSQKGVVKTTDFPDHKGSLYKEVIHPAISGDIKVSKSALFLSFALDQLLWQEKIAPYKGSKTEHFIADGYFTTNIVYQSLMSKTFELQQVLHFAETFGIIKPDFNVFLDVDPEIAMGRKEIEEGHDEGLDIYESSFDKQCQIRAGFKKMIEENIFGKWGEIDGNGGRSDVTDGLIKILIDNNLI